MLLDEEHRLVQDTMRAFAQEHGTKVASNENDVKMWAAIGAGIALDHLDVIRRSLPTEEENLVGLFPGPEIR